MSKQNVAVIFGGQSSEHEVSCKSAINVIRGLDEDKYNVHLVGITKEGFWKHVKSVEDIENDTWKQSKEKAVISPDRQQKGIIVMSEDHTYETIPVDVIFPVLHGMYGEDGTIQGLFDLSGIPYVGCGVLASAVAMDKISTKIFVDRLGICQAKYVTDTARGCGHIDKTMDDCERKLGYPVFVKPSNAGSSQGVSKASNREELAAAIKLAKKHDRRVLIEEMITGREIECAVLGNDDVEPSMPGEILAAADFYDYDAKYNNPDSQTDTHPELNEDVREEVRHDAVRIFKTISGAGLSRVDFFVEDKTNRVVFNEINTMPGFTNISMYPMLWKEMGKEKSSLLNALINCAMTR